MNVLILVFANQTLLLESYLQFCKVDNQSSTRGSSTEKNMMYTECTGFTKPVHLANSFSHRCMSHIVSATVMFLIHHRLHSFFCPDFSITNPQTVLAEADCQRRLR